MYVPGGADVRLRNRSVPVYLCDRISVSVCVHVCECIKVTAVCRKKKKQNAAPRCVGSDSA